MKKTLLLVFVLISFATSSFALGPISGTTTICVNAISHLVDTLNPGGVWTSGNTSVATINPTSGNVRGVAAGSAVITYTLGASSITTTVTVNPLPGPITGTTTFCTGTTSTLTATLAGGTWQSTNVTIATVNSLTGVVTGLSAGTTNIGYSTGCYTSVTVNVLAPDPGVITGLPSTCVGSSITLADTGTALVGVWSSSNVAVASVSSAGVVTGGSLGTAIISYTVTDACGTVSATKTINIINTTPTGTISGTTSLSLGLNATLHETIAGGTWSSSNVGIATINATSGVMGGVSLGTVVITYSLTGCGGAATATHTVTIAPYDIISGHVNFPGAFGHGPVKIWLIKYNPTTLDLQAIDSTNMNCYNCTSVSYQFTGALTDSYRVKASIYDSFGLTTGYIPTYHNSSLYWHSANVFYHTSGIPDFNKDINMMYGTPTTGPGFIGGNVTTGANKGTHTTGIPVVGLSMNVLNSSNQLMQSVRTNASGNYSFSNLPAGTYTVFPDSLNYMTTAYTSITLTAAAPTVNNAGFIQHTISKTITPNPVALNTVNSAASSVIAFPNPASSKLNVQWTVNATENGTVAITDITGREVYKSAINMNAGTGMKQIDLSSFINGLYVISVKSATINYNNKIQVQH